jgi:hypothetical protein
MTVPNGAILRISARFTGPHQQDIINTYTLETDFASPQDETDVLDACDTYLSSIYEEFDDHIVAVMDPLDMKVDVIQFISGKWEVTQNVGSKTWGSTIATTGAFHTLPEAASAVGFLYTLLGKHAGRKFFGGFDENANSPTGAIDSTVQTDIITGITKLLTPYVISAGNNLASVVIDHAVGTVRNVISVGLKGFWGYQRRRIPGRGS